MRLRHLLYLIVVALFAAGTVQAQTVAPLIIKDGNGTLQPLCEFQPSTTNPTAFAGCTINWTFNGTAWGVAPADTSGRPAISAPDGALQSIGPKSDATGCTYTGAQSATVICELAAIYGAINGPLPNGSAFIGSINNTQFGISGNLPNYSSTPPFKVHDANDVDVSDVAAHAIKTASPCNLFAPVNQTASTLVIAAPATTGQAVHICSILLFVNAAQAVQVVEGTTALCAANTLAIIGGAAGASPPGPNWNSNTPSSSVGLQLNPGQGFNSTAGVPILNAAANQAICILQAQPSVSGTAAVLSGYIAYGVY